MGKKLIRVTNSLRELFFDTKAQSREDTKFFCFTQSSQRSKGIETQTKSQEVKMLAAFFTHKFFKSKSLMLEYAFNLKPLNF